ncbi:hypothetical protein J2S55_005827 [Streptosporangium brasiliense]|uniref:Uncharacterized protein n=1 Tax=Streptosporangium brasiliense TaxID=47480 RepID=A0ABT9RBD3_9ACTN|nr:hypothetical protein [Streptosporangium brasiliense]
MPVFLDQYSGAYSNTVLRDHTVGTRVHRSTRAKEH